MKYIFAIKTFLLAVVLAASAQAFEVKDSKGLHQFEKPAERVVTLNWGATEHAIELGITPVGIAEIEGYRDWVVVPALPEDSTNVGRRAEPNYEVIASLNPDLIIIGSNQQAMIEALEKIAPVLYFDNYREDHDNMAAIDASLIEMGKALGREAKAHALLTARAARLKELRAELEAEFDGSLPALSVIRFVSHAHVRIYGANSTVEAAMNGLGLKQAIAIEASKWGQVQRKITDLAQNKDGMVLYILPFAHTTELDTNPIWQHMPFVKTGMVGPMDSAWTYSGAMSVQYIAERLVKAMRAIKAAQIKTTEKS